jgi:hypothetical protein
MRIIMKYIWWFIVVYGVYMFWNINKLECFYVIKDENLYYNYRYNKNGIF